ncbi:MAG: glycosyltransferase family 4 protein [Alphaproteobacteria bacterium]|nr:glycosyltransferase family 4 protein [Alphaproteobacteria bacterium]
MSGAKPRVLFLVTEDWYFSAHWRGLAGALTAAGCAVGVVCRVGGGGDAITGAGLQLFPLQMSRSSINPLHLAACVLRIARIYRAFRPDIVHHVALKPALLGSIAAGLAGVQRIINAIAGLGYVFASTGPRARLLRPVLRAALRLWLDGPETRVMVQNVEDGEALTGAGIVAAERLRVVPGVGVDLERFHPTAEPPGPPRAVLVSRLIREKGIHETVEAARLLAARGVDVRIALAGESDLESPSAIAVETLESWRAEGAVEILGRVEDIPGLWEKSHIALLPSYYREGVPQALLEAAACGRPLIAADGPGLRDIVRDGETGILVPPRDPAALADAIERLAGDAALRQRMGAAGRRLAETRFGADAINDQTIAIYRELLADAWPAPAVRP